MASVLKVDKLDPQSGTALEIGTSGDTVSIPSGATLDISASTLTPPATMPASSGVNLTALNATQLTSGKVPTAQLGTGTASSSTVLYGDQTYKAEPGLTGWAVDGGNNDLLPASASAGIYLGVSSATASNLLDDYEEGTFNADITVSGGGTITTSSWDTLFYTKIGRLVHVQGQINVNGVAGSLTGLMKITGLPFTSDAGSEGAGYGNISINFWDGETGIHVPVCYVDVGTTNLGVLEFNGESNVNISDHLKNGCAVRIGGSYVAS